MNSLKRVWLRLQGQDCYSCQFSDVFRSNGDGQVSRLHTFCRHPQSRYQGRPIPTTLWCDHWQRAHGGRKNKPEEIDNTGLTA